MGAEFVSETDSRTKIILDDIVVRKEIISTDSHHELMMDWHLNAASECAGKSGLLGRDARKPDGQRVGSNQRMKEHPPNIDARPSKELIIMRVVSTSKKIASI